MISARLKTPPTVGRENLAKGLIPRLQHRYAALLRWTLEHRGKSVLGILLIIAVSIVPMMLTKKNMFGGDGGEQVGINYQWKGSYTKEQMSDEVLRGRELPRRQPQELPHQADLLVLQRAGRRDTVVTFDSKDAKVTKPLSEPSARTCRSPRAPPSRSATMATMAAAPGQNVQVQLVGDSTQTLEDLADDIVPILSRAQGTARRARRCRRPEQRAHGARRSRARGRVRVQRRRRVAVRRPRACAARRCANSAAARPRCRCGCASPAPRTTASRTSPRSRCARPTAAPCRC